MITEFLFLIHSNQIKQEVIIYIMYLVKIANLQQDFTLDPQNQDGMVGLVVVDSLNAQDLIIL